MSPLLRFLYDAASIHIDPRLIREREIAPVMEVEEIDQYTCDHMGHKVEWCEDYIQYTCRKCGKKW